METTSEWKIANSRYKHYRFNRSILQEINTLKPNNWHGLTALMSDYVIIAACVYLCVLKSWWFYPLAVLVIGARQRGLSTILHDSAHGVCARNHTLNMLLGTVLTAYPIFQRHYAYKLSHVQTHHPYLGDPIRDPDLSFFIAQGVYNPMPPSKYFQKFLILPLLGSRTLAYLGYLFKNRFKYFLHQDERNTKENQNKERSWKRTIDEIAFYIFWLMTLVIAYKHGFLLCLVLLWVVPYLTSFHILGWFIELSEHTPLVQHNDVDLYMTRNRKSRGLEKFLTGIHNDDYHLDHHLDPRTPFYHLPKARMIRLRDPNYAALDAATGGLFTDGPNGAPSAISAILTTMHQRYHAVESAQTAQTAQTS